MTTGDVCDRPITAADIAAADITAADICWELQPGPWPTSTPADVDLLTRVCELEHERDIYRQLAQQALHALHDVTAERDRLRHAQRPQKAVV